MLVSCPTAPLPKPFNARTNANDLLPLPRSVRPVPEVQGPANSCRDSQARHQTPADCCAEAAALCRAPHPCPCRCFAAVSISGKQTTRYQLKKAPMGYSGQQVAMHEVSWDAHVTYAVTSCLHAVTSCLLLQATAHQLPSMVPEKITEACRQPLIIDGPSACQIVHRSVCQAHQAFMLAWSAPVQSVTAW